MAGARLEIYDTTLTTIQDALDFNDVASGETSTTIHTLKIKNDGAGTASNIKLFFRTANNVYTGQTTANGQEAVTGKWCEVDAGSGYVAIGGDFGNQGVAANYIQVAGTLTAGSATATISIRYTIPSTALTNGTFRAIFGVSYDGY